MENKLLSHSERQTLIFWHNHREDKARYADRIKAVLWFDEGVSIEEIASRLFLDIKTPRRWLETYKQGGLDALIVDNYTVYAGKLTLSQMQQLYNYVDTHLFVDIYPILVYVQDEFNVSYSPSGMRDLLHRLGFVYKKASPVPGEASRLKQALFLARFKQFMSVKSTDTAVLFMDSTHPRYNSMAVCGWIAKGKRAEVPTTADHHQRLNINGAVNCETHELLTVFSERMTAEAAIELLEKIESRYSSSAHIVVICDNASYYRARPIQEYLRQSRISLVHLPPYSPNLNLIERVWKMMHKHVVYNRLQTSFKEFREEIITFFHRLSDDLLDSLKSLLTLNFAIAPTNERRRMTVI